MRDLIGIPFVNGGRDPKKGLDCMGLTIAARKKLGQSMPDFKVDCYASAKIFATFTMEAASHWQKLDAPEIGCVVAIAFDEEMPDQVQHLGVYIGKDNFIHTLEKTGSIISSVNDLQFKNRIRGYYKWIG